MAQHDYFGTVRLIQLNSIQSQTALPMFNILAALKRHLPAAAVMMLSVNFLAQVAQPSAAKDSEMKEGKLGQRKQHTKNVSYKLMTVVVGGILTPLSV